MIETITHTEPKKHGKHLNEKRVIITNINNPQDSYSGEYENGIGKSYKGKFFLYDGHSNSENWSSTFGRVFSKDDWTVEEIIETKKEIL